MIRQKIICDCDPGHDDAVALMLAANSPELELLGVTVVAGNQTLDNTARNACPRCSGWAGRIFRSTRAADGPWSGTG